MTTDTVLTDAEIFGIFDTCSDLPLHYDPDEIYVMGRAIEQAVLESAKVQALRDALEDVSQWMDSQADAQSKGGHATFDIMMLREKRDIARAALAAMEKQP